VIVYLPVRAAMSARVGTGTPRGVGAKAPARKGLVSKTPAAARQPIVREKRGGTPARSKR
jgi:membrane-bound lytic murein transglycosylase D